jgi:hypothetical protein
MLIHAWFYRFQIKGHMSARGTVWSCPLLVKVRKELKEYRIDVFHVYHRGRTGCVRSFLFLRWGKTDVSPFGTSTIVWSIVPAPDDRWLLVRSGRWNENWQGKPKYPEKNLLQCHFVNHKSPHDLTWVRTRLSYGTATCEICKKLRQNSYQSVFVIWTMYVRFDFLFLNS